MAVREAQLGALNARVRAIEAQLDLESLRGSLLESLGLEVAADAN